MTEDSLALDVEEAAAEIEALISGQLQLLGRSGVLVGLSGGLDSSLVAYLAVRAVGRERVRLLYLPERDSKAEHRRDAQLVAAALDVQLQIEEITPVLRAHGVDRLLPIRYIPGRQLKGGVMQLGERIVRRLHGERYLENRMNATGGSLTARGNAYASSKHRVRMVRLYYHADRDSLMVVGAANRTEWLTGTFSMWGCDHCADVMPLLHLYRSQLEPLAEYVGVPEPIRHKKADPDVLPGIEDKEALLGSFKEVDQILAALETGINPHQFSPPLRRETVRRVSRLYAASRPMRESPYTIQYDGSAVGLASAPVGERRQRGPSG